MSVFRELRRRRVFRVAGIYVLIAWIIAEAADVIFPALLLPDWTVTFVIALLVMGFPVAMLLAWAFDITPGGLERTPAKEDAGKASRSKLHVVTYGLMLVLGTAILVALIYPGGPRGVWQDARQLIGLQPAAREGVIYTSIAVLPFDNISKDPENEYFCAGMSEEILNLLARTPDLKVAARTSSFAYRDTDKDIRDIAGELQVETILEGSVRKDESNRVRITAQLIDASTGFHLWSKTFDRQLEDVFAVQDEIASAIVEALQLRLASGDTQPTSRGMRRTHNTDAYDAYLRGRNAWMRRGEAAIRQSIELFDRALSLDPNYAEAYSAKAAAWVVLPLYSNGEAERAYAEAEAAAFQALALDDSLAEPHAVLAEISAQNRLWADAQVKFYYATVLNPNDSTAYHWHSGQLRQLGRLQDSLQDALKAYERDPKSPVINANLASAYTSVGKNEQALEYFEAARNLGFNVDQGYLAVLLLMREGRLDEAEQLLRNRADEIGIPPETIRPLIDATNSPQRLASMLDEVNATERVPKQSLLAIYITGGLHEQALALASELAETGELDLEMLWLPEAARMRTYPAFSELAEKLEMNDFWRRFGWPDGCSGDSEGRLECQSPEV